MDNEQFEEIHKVFIKSYNLEECAWYESQRQYMNLREEIRRILNGQQ